MACGGSAGWIWSNMVRKDTRIRRIRRKVGPYGRIFRAEGRNICCFPKHRPPSFSTLIRSMAKTSSGDTCCPFVNEFP